jgi:hypothetical protein
MNKFIAENFTESTNSTFKSGDLVQLTRERSKYTAITCPYDMKDAEFFSIGPNDVCVILSSGYTTNITGDNADVHFCLVRGQIVKTSQGIFELVQFTQTQ